MIQVLAVFAVPVAFLSGGVAFSAWRSGETGMAIKSTAVLGLCVMLFIAAPKSSVIDLDAECWVGWDARSNRTVCD